MSMAKHLALLGGPSSGKSTYLSALLNAVELANVPVTLRDPPKDRTALDSLQDPLLDSHYPQRTAKDVRLALEVPLQYEQTPFTLHVLDYAGEGVDDLFTARRWTPQWEAWAACDALLLFLRPTAGSRPRPPRPPQSDAERWKALRQGPAEPETPGLHVALALPSIEDLDGPGVLGDSPPTPPTALFDPMPIPSALAVVELLQLLRHARRWSPGQWPPRGSLRVAVVVSAWDSVGPAWQEQGPAAWLASEVALVEDLLQSSFHPDDVRRYGLSSTGGDLKDPRYQARYNVEDETTRWVVYTNPLTGRVEHEAGVCSPLLWALFGDHRR